MHRVHHNVLCFVSEDFPDCWVQPKVHLSAHALKTMHLALRHAPSPLPLSWAGFLVLAIGLLLDFSDVNSSRPRLGLYRLNSPTRLLAQASAYGLNLWVSARSSGKSSGFESWVCCLLVKWPLLKRLITETAWSSIFIALRNDCRVGLCFYLSIYFAVLGIKPRIFVAGKTSTTVAKFPCPSPPPPTGTSFKWLWSYSTHESKAFMI